MVKGKRKHNKSGMEGLSLLSHPSKEIRGWVRRLKEALSKAPGTPPIAGSPCLLISARDGRFSVGGKKVHGYQLAAFDALGRSKLKRVPSTKKRAEDLVISHLCGTRNCCSGSHLVLEAKRINDERTHCHFALANIRRNKGQKGVRRAMKLGLCPHDPPCCTLSRNK